MLFNNLHIQVTGFIMVPMDYQVIFTADKCVGGLHNSDLKCMVVEEHVNNMCS